jgi:monofunctional biosynthetic peptidoglycan transglycosylase
VLRRLRRAWRITIVVLVLLAATMPAVHAWHYAQILWWTRHAPQSTAFMGRRLDELREKDPRARLRHRWVPYARVSSELKRAVIAAEDARFLDHEGFDWEAIQKALEKNERRGKVVAGGSTISQQLAKNLFLSGERSWLRKAREALLTAMLEHAMDKRRILELYLNFAEWGDGVFGAEAAARHHFNVSAAQLSTAQAAWLAAILPSPRRYARGETTPYLEARIATIRRHMAYAQIP